MVELDLVLLGSISDNLTIFPALLYPQQTDGDKEPMPIKDNDQANSDHFLGAQIDRVIAETTQLHARFKQLVSRFSNDIVRDMRSTSRDSLMFSPGYWKKQVYHSSFIKLRLILENNLSYIETLGLLATTRYVFEVLVWLRIIEKDERYGLSFYAQVLDNQLRHLESYRKKVESEIVFFEALAEEERRLSKDAISRLKATPHDNPGQVAENASAALNSISREIDLRARRNFSLYRREAQENGYGFQAYLMKNRGLDELDRHVADIESKWTELWDNSSEDVRGLFGSRGNLRTTWNWRARSADVGMEEQYRFLYSYTSRLLHATPVSMFTDQKNLELREVLNFLEFIHVSMLDILDMGEKRGQ